MFAGIVVALIVGLSGWSHFRAHPHKVTRGTVTAQDVARPVWMR